MIFLTTADGILNKLKKYIGKLLRTDLIKTSLLTLDKVLAFHTVNIFLSFQ